jgi:hypothetical protein
MRMRARVVFACERCAWVTGGRQQAARAARTCARAARRRSEGSERNRYVARLHRCLRGASRRCGAAARRARAPRTTRFLPITLSWLGRRDSTTLQP